MLSSDGHHFLKSSSERPACNIPGVARTTIGPGLSAKERSNGLMCSKSNEKQGMDNLLKKIGFKIRGKKLNEITQNTRRLSKKFSFFC